MPTLNMLHDFSSFNLVRCCLTFLKFKLFLIDFIFEFEFFFKSHSKLLHDFKTFSLHRYINSLRALKSCNN